MKKPIPSKPLASPGRLPSDIDGDEQRVECESCGTRIWEKEAIKQWTPRGAVTYCHDCADENW